jgi:hypothetical protein
MHANNAIRASIMRLGDILSRPNGHERMLIGQVCFVAGWSLMWASALARAGLGTCAARDIYPAGRARARAASIGHNRSGGPIPK